LSKDLKIVSLENIEKKKTAVPNPNAYTIESRTEMYKEIAEKKEKTE
jgi:hypothetical protein